MIRFFQRLVLLVSLVLHSSAASTHTLDLISRQKFPEKGLVVPLYRKNTVAQSGIRAGGDKSGIEVWDTERGESIRQRTTLTSSNELLVPANYIMYHITYFIDL
jgi:hypothetical protein